MTPLSLICKKGKNEVNHIYDDQIKARVMHADKKEAEKILHPGTLSDYVRECLRKLIEENKKTSVSKKFQNTMRETEALAVKMEKKHEDIWGLMDE